VDDDRITELIDRADLDELVRAVDALCVSRSWEQLLGLRDRCRAAGRETGRQLWPIASLAEYRLALDAPGRWAATVVTESTGRFVLGPLTEVAASTHRWDELSPHLASGPAAAYVAHERVLRGEDLRDAPDVDTAVLELPLMIQPWEPVYALATYHHDRIETPAPDLPALVRVDLPDGDGVERVDDPEVTEAFRDLVAPWTASSNGRCDVVCVTGDHRRALTALGQTSARVGPLAPSQGLAMLAWAGASGGAFGSRRGGAAGRWEAWWLLASLTDRRDALDDIDALGHAAALLQWWAWDAEEPVTGWSLRLAIHDPIDDIAWAVVATDTA